MIQEPLHPFISSSSQCSLIEYISSFCWSLLFVPLVGTLGTMANLAYWGCHAQAFNLKSPLPKELQSQDTGRPFSQEMLLALKAKWEQETEGCWESRTSALLQCCFLSLPPGYSDLKLGQGPCLLSVLWFWIYFSTSVFLIYKETHSEVGKCILLFK